MRTKSISFDHRHDPVLGTALREALSAEDHSAFVARVVGVLAMPHAFHWEVLASWSRRGIAVACLGALGAGLLVNVLQPPLDLVSSLAGPSARELMATAYPPDPSIILVPPEVR